MAKSAGIFSKIKEYVEEATSAVTQDKDEKIPNNFVSLDTLLANNKRWARNKVRYRSRLPFKRMNVET